MTAISWKSAVSGKWSTASDWNPAQVPGIGDDVTIAATGASYTVAAAKAGANSLLLDSSTATIGVRDGNFTMGGVLTLSAGTLALEYGFVQGGTIEGNGGRLASTNGTFDDLTCEGKLALASPNNSLTLSRVTYDGTLAVSGNADVVTIDSSDTFAGTDGSGAAMIYLTGANSSIHVLGTTTLDNATINIGSDTSYASLESYDPYDRGSVLTLGSKLTLIQTQADANLSDYGFGKDGVINQGSIRAGYRYGNFTVYGNSFTNQGAIAILNADSFAIESTHFINSGSISVTNGAGLSISSLFTNSGSISVTDGAVLDIGGTVATSGLAGISVSSGSSLYLGTLLNTGASLHVGTGTALGTIRVADVIGGVVVDTSGGLIAGTLDGVTYRGTLDVSSTGLMIKDGITFSGVNGSGPGTVNLNNVANVVGVQTLDNAAINIGNGGTLFSFDVLGNGATLTLGSNLVVTETGATAYLRDSGNPKDAIVNQGSIVAGIANGQFNISGERFANYGSVATSNGDTLNITSSTFGNDAAASLSGSGTISSTVNNAGTIIANGDTLAFLYNVNNNGTMEASTGLLSSQNSVVGTGTLDIGATGTLSLLDGASSGQTVDFLALTGSLDLSVPLDFQGTIAGFGGSNQIDLVNTPETGHSYSGGVLSVQNGSATVASLHFAGSYTQSNFVLGSDGHGGTAITFT